MRKQVSASSPRVARAFTWRSPEKGDRLDYGRIYAVIRQGAEPDGQQFNTKDIKELKEIREIIR